MNITIDTHKLIKQELAKNKATNLLKAVYNTHPASHFSNSELEQAISYLDSMGLDTLGQNLNTMLQLSELLFLNGELDRAYEFADQILSLEQNKEAYLTKAKCLYQWGNYPDSLIQLENIKALELSEDDTNTVLGLIDRVKHKMYYNMGVYS